MTEKDTKRLFPARLPKPVGSCSVVGRPRSGCTGSGPAATPPPHAKLPKPPPTDDRVRCNGTDADSETGCHPQELAGVAKRRASGGSRTHNPRITNAVLCQLKLRWRYCVVRTYVDRLAACRVFHTCFHTRHPLATPPRHPFLGKMSWQRRSLKNLAPIFHCSPTATGNGPRKSGAKSATLGPGMILTRPWQIIFKARAQEHPTKRIRYQVRENRESPTPTSPSSRDRRAAYNRLPNLRPARRFVFSRGPAPPPAVMIPA